MVTWADVVKWDIEPVLDARHQVQTAEGAMQNNGEVIERAHQDFSSEGLAAYAASTSLEEVFKDIDFVEAQLTDLLTALQSATSRLNELVRRVKGALDYAVDERLRILDDGTVEFTEQIWNDARRSSTHAATSTRSTRQLLPSTRGHTNLQSRFSCQRTARKRSEYDSYLGKGN